MHILFTTGFVFEIGSIMIVKISETAFNVCRFIKQ